LDKKKDERRISFNFSRTFFHIKHSLHNFVLDVSSVVDITKIVYIKKKAKKGGKKIKKEEINIALLEDER